MAFGDGTFRARAASLLRPSTPSTGHSFGQSTIQEKASSNAPNSYLEHPLNEKTPVEPGQNNLEKTRSLSSSGQTYHSSGLNAVAHDREAQRIVRTIPAWVHTLDEEDEDLIAAARSLPESPANTQTAQHNTTPSDRPQHKSASHRGRLYDSRRGQTPPLLSGESGSRWKAFTTASAYPSLSAEGGEIVTQEWLARHGADYSRPWLAGTSDGDREKDPAGLYRFRSKRTAWYIRAQRTLLRNPVVPMVIRLNVWCFSAIALGLAASIHHKPDPIPVNSTTSTASTQYDIPRPSNPSADMAIIVDAVAMIYLLYITYDEYTGKPLGLRPAKAKMRLVFLDLFFIVFDAANLSLAFESIRSSECNSNCVRPRALASVLLIALIAWLLTFAISVMRLVERVTG